MPGIPDELHNFILENFLFGDDSREISPDDSFLTTGIVDSTGIIELIAFVETRFGIQVEDSELLPDNFDTISSLTRFIEKKLNGCTP